MFIKNRHFGDFGYVGSRGRIVKILFALDSGRNGQQNVEGILKKNCREHIFFEAAKSEKTQNCTTPCFRLFGPKIEQKI